MKIIQICGTNGTGKTTLVKGILACGNFMKLYIQVDGATNEYWFDGKTAVIGKYNEANCCGVDAGKYSSDLLLKTIRAVVEKEHPQTVVFEDIRFGGSFTFKQKLKRLSDNVGYGYHIMALVTSLECSSNRVLNRSGNANANYDAMRGKARQVISSTKKAGDIGAKFVFCDTEKNDRAAVLNVFRRVANEQIG